MLAIVWPLLIAVVGAFVYALSANGKAQELGRILFSVGAFWVTYSLLGDAFHLGG